jgi:hypothetical protein
MRKVMRIRNPAWDTKPMKIHLDEELALLFTGFSLLKASNLLNFWLNIVID